MDYSMPGLPVHHQLLMSAQTHVHRSVMSSNHLILCHPLLLLPSIFPASGSFPMSQFFVSGGKHIGASASVLSKNIQDSFPLGLMDLISLQFKGLSWFFSNTLVQKHRFNAWVRNIPWRRAWQLTLVFLPGESHEGRNPMGYSPCSPMELDIIEAT